MTTTSIESAAIAETEPAKKPFSLLSDEKLTEIYVLMLKSRLLAGRVGQTGREAVLAGMLVDLNSDDTLALAEPDPAASFIIGVSLPEIARQLAARKNNAKTASAETLAEAVVDAAWEKCKRKKNEIVVAFPPADWAAQAPWRQAIHMVRDRRLPVIFVCDEPLIAATETEAGKSFEPGFPRIPVDRHDAVAVYRVASESIVRARKGCWPTLVECVDFAFEGRAESAPGEDLSDPIFKMEQYLRRKGIFNESLKDEVVAEFARQVESAVCACLSE